MTKTVHNQFDSRLYDLDAFGKLESLGFSDDSWGNDTCPKLWRDGKGYRVQIWIETMDPEMREFEGELQFTAVIESEPGHCRDRCRSLVIARESLKELIELINSEYPWIDCFAKHG